MSKDMCDNTIKNIWRLSEIKLNQSLCHCTCVITAQNTWHPTLFVLGGYNKYDHATKAHLQYDLCDIMGYHTFYRFMIDLKQVYFFYIFFLFA